VAVEDAQVTYIGSYSVYLTVMKDGATVRRYTYLHMNMTDVRSRIALNQMVTKGQVIGSLSNEFGNDSNHHPVPDQTTPHLHFEIQTSVTGTDGNGHFTFASPYMTLVKAYQGLLASGNAGDCPP
jgi:murein DD-endopeptidase MepM/ murein hydrolase activator NlpD